MSEAEIEPTHAHEHRPLPRQLGFWGAAVVLLGPLLVLIVHRTGAPVAIPREPSPLTSIAPKTTPQSQEVTRALTESQRLIDLGQAESSLDSIRRALALDPKNTVAFNNLCVAYGLLKQREPAISACNRALELDPANERVRNNLRWVSSLSERATP
jgi:tetratricopeptide (TPR) repeat protein